MPESRGKAIIERVSLAIAPEVEAVVRNPFFMALCQGKVSLEGLKLFANEYFLASNSFPRILAAACTGMSTDELRMPFVINLWDEHGQGNNANSHRAQLMRFLQFLGVTPTETRGGPAEHYLSTMIELCRNATESALLGILCPGCEVFTPREYRLIVESIQKSFSIPDAALEFFLEHIKHDYQHISSFQRAFEIAVKDNNDLMRAVEGAKQAVAVEQRFWADMHTHVFRSDPSPS